MPYYSFVEFREFLMRDSKRPDRFSDRVRFNWGFHDGSLEASWGSDHIRNVTNHPDSVYAEGYQRGVTEFQQTRERPTSSEAAWADYTATA